MKEGESCGIFGICRWINVIVILIVVFVVAFSLPQIWFRYFSAEEKTESVLSETAETNLVNITNIIEKNREGQKTRDEALGRVSKILEEGVEISGISRILKDKLGVEYLMVDLAGGLVGVEDEEGEDPSFLVTTTEGEVYFVQGEEVELLHGE
ncbi:MAG TPA: hypothetical protein ENI70_00575 [Candidatus Peregrinibacteria bacterium]|nr:hypothetical protein [Candidatus Peregrinibacteria bacterium]